MSRRYLIATSTDPSVTATRTVAYFGSLPGIQPQQMYRVIRVTVIGTTANIAGVTSSQQAATATLARTTIQIFDKQLSIGDFLESYAMPVHDASFTWPLNPPLDLPRGSNGLFRVLEGYESSGGATNPDKTKISVINVEAELFDQDDEWA